MFSKLYKKSMDNIKPDELLVQKTKNAMHKELKKKPKTFYKYAAVAACFIITFSLFRTTYKSSNSLNSAPSNSFTSNSDLGIGSLNSGMATEVNENTASDSVNRPFPSQYFKSAGGVKFNLADSSSAMGSSSILGKFWGWIRNVIEWLRNLFS